VIPATRVSPVSQKLFKFFPAPNVAGGRLASNYLALANNVTNKDQFTTRIDFVESSRSNWFGRFSWDDELNIAPALVLNGSSLQTHVDQWMIDNVRVLKPNLVNEFRFGFNHFFNSLASQLSGARDVVKELGIPGLAGSRDLWQRWPGRSDRSRGHRLGLFHAAKFQLHGKEISPVSVRGLQPSESSELGQPRRRIGRQPPRRRRQAHPWRRPLRYHHLHTDRDAAVAVQIEDGFLSSLRT